MSFLVLLTAIFAKRDKKGGRTTNSYSIKAKSSAKGRGRASFDMLSNNVPRRFAVCLKVGDFLERREDSSTFH